MWNEPSKNPLNVILLFFRFRRLSSNPKFRWKQKSPGFTTTKDFNVTIQYDNKWNLTQCMERFSMDSSHVVVSLTNHKVYRQSYEPITTQSKTCNRRQARENTIVTLASILLLTGYENGPRFDSQSQSKSVQINTMVREANFWVAPRLFLKTRVSPNSLIRKIFFRFVQIKLIFKWKLLQLAWVWKWEFWHLKVTHTLLKTTPYR